ncbi:MAG: phage tail family protein [Bacillota bacterium]|nr:phage tail family protein [Bacillota bacterium]
MIGFAYRGKHSREFEGLVLKTNNNQLIPSKRFERISVPGRNGQYIFEDGYNNKILEFDCSLIKGNIQDRRQRAREIAYWLSGTGDLILDGEDDKTYKVVRTVSDIDLSLNQVIENFKVVFETEPFQLGTFKSISVDNPTNITLINDGTEEAETVISVTGTGDVSLTLDDKILNLTGLTEKITLDSKKYLAYNDLKENKLDLHMGDFIKIPPGSSELLMTGTVSNILIEYYDTYI